MSILRLGSPMSLPGCQARQLLGWLICYLGIERRPNFGERPKPWSMPDGYGRSHAVQRDRPSRDFYAGLLVIRRICNIAGAFLAPRLLRAKSRPLRRSGGRCRSKKKRLPLQNFAGLPAAKRTTGDFAAASRTTVVRRSRQCFLAAQAGIRRSPILGRSFAELHRRDLANLHHPLLPELSAYLLHDGLDLHHFGFGAWL